MVFSQNSSGARDVFLLLIDVVIIRLVFVHGTFIAIHYVMFCGYCYMLYYSQHSAFNCKMRTFFLTGGRVLTVFKEKLCVNGV